MNESEKRRRQLLEQTRSLYTDQGIPPAVHPRYGSVYTDLYSSGEETGKGTFGIRVMLCLLLFAAFATMDYQGTQISSVGSEKIVEVVEYQPDIEEVFQDR